MCPRRLGSIHIPKESKERKRPALNAPRVLGRQNAKRKRVHVLQRDNYICQHCCEAYPETNLEADHIVPLHLGGEDTIDNMQCLCIPCHKIKTAAEAWARSSKES
jgi:5-methylcytosine-specific restriction endonuclease McrA